jgi:hypothetical protein
MFTNINRPSAVDVLRPFSVGDQFYADTTSTLAKRTIGATNDVYTVTGGVPVWSSSITLTALTVVDSGFTIVGSTNSNRTLKFEVDAQSANVDLTINTGAQTADRTLTVPVLTGDATLMALSETQTVTGFKTFSNASGIMLDSGATPSNQQFTLKANALGACGWLCYSADNSQLNFDVEWTGAALIARDTTAFNLVKSGGTLRIRGNSGLSVNSSVSLNDLVSVSPGGSFLAVTATGGLGYGTGAGGTVTQGSGSGKATTVVLNKVCGTITMDGAALNADTTVAFTFTNSAIASTDLVVMQHTSGGTLGAYNFAVAPGSGTATVSVRNVTPGNLSEAIVIRFAIIKAVTS